MQFLGKYFAIVVLMGVSTLLVAQDFRILGKVREGATQLPVGYASVAVYSVVDTSLLAGTITDDAGGFELKCKSAAEVFVMIQFMGYEDYRSSPLLLDRDIYLGLVELRPGTLLFSEV